MTATSGDDWLARRELLGEFDFLRLGLSFTGRPPHPDGQPENVEFDRFAPGDAEFAEHADTFVRQIFRDVPRSVLVHELSHMYQVSTTSSGVRSLLEMHQYLGRCQELLRVVAEDNDGQFPIGFLGLRSRDDDINDYIDQVGRGVRASRETLVTLEGGTRISVRTLDDYRVVADDDDLFEVESLFNDGTRLWCLDLTAFGGPDAVAVLLGNRHLLEGQAAMLEWMRRLAPGTNGSPPDGEAGDLTDGLPADPYHLAYSIYRSTCDARPADAAPPEVEFVLLADSALMVDDWPTVPVKTIQSGEYRWDNRNAFVHFVVMCRALRENPELSLRSLDRNERRRFQNTMLAAAGAPHPDVDTITARLASAARGVLSDIRRANPLFGDVATRWEQVFDYLLASRIQLGHGTCNLLSLVVQPDEILIRVALLGGRVYPGYMSVVDDGTTPDEVFEMMSTHHSQSLLEGLVQGDRPCLVRAECRLPGRFACQGVPDLGEVRPAGERCTRERALLDICATTGVTKLLRRRTTDSRRGKQARREAHGADDMRALVLRNDLAVQRGEQGDPAGAAVDLRELLSDVTRVCGPDDPMTILVGLNLSAWQRAAGEEVSTAQLRDEKEKAIRLLGSDDIDALRARNNRAKALGESGEHAEALREFQALLPDLSRVLGADDEHTLSCKANIATEIAHLSGAADGVRAFERVVEELARVLGPVHDQSVTNRRLLAWWRSEAGDLAGALADSQALLSDVETQLGPASRSLSLILDDVAQLRVAAGNLDGAFESSQRAAKLHAALDGAGHPATRRARARLAHIRRLMIEKEVERRVAEFGDESLEAFDGRIALATSASKLGDYPAAMTILRDVVDRERRLERTGETLIIAKANLASTVKDSGDPVAALPEYEQALGLAVAAFGTNHDMVLTMRFNIALAREAADDHLGALADLKRLRADLPAAPGADHHLAGSVAERIDALESRQSR